MEEAREHPAVGKGSLPTLVLLPGMDGTGILFRPLLDALPPETHAQVCAYPGDVFLPPEKLAETVAETIAGLGDVVILAESWSGLVCLELLRQRPDNVRGVIFVACFAEPPRPWVLGLSRLLPLSALLRAPPPDILVRHYCLGADAGAGRIALFREALAAVQPDVLARRLRGIGRYRDPIEGPACYIQAMDDRLVPAGTTADFNALSPELEIHRVNGPHFVLQSRPTECAAIIADFLRRAPLRTH